MNSFPTPMTERDALTRLISRLAPVSPTQPLIRLGPAGDGGYLVPDDLEGIEACFSPGVGGSFGFEHDCAQLGMQAFLLFPSQIIPKQFLGFRLLVSKHSPE